MIEIKKLNENDLNNLAIGLEIDIEIFSKVGSIHLEVDDIKANLRVPTLIDSEKELSMLIEFKSMNEKVAFTYDDLEIREQSTILTEPHKYDQNYFHQEKSDHYRVFVKKGVVTYLTEREVAGLYLIFKEVKKLVEGKYNYN
jgi:hypothetical protein